MKKISVLLMAALAIVLFSCGNGNGTKNENNQDSTATTQNVVENQGINSFEFMTKVSQDKKFLNENLDKTVVITDLLAGRYEKGLINGNERLLVYAFTYNPNDNKSINDEFTFLKNSTYKGKQIQVINIDEKFKMTTFEIILKDSKQAKTLSFFDATKDYNYASAKDGNGKDYYKFEDLIKVKGTVTYDSYSIVLNDAEIIK
ncbi:MAG: hypothetical protein ACOYO1_19890 [Bacteroidales bacterium]